MRKDKGEKVRERKRRREGETEGEQGREIRFGWRYFGSAVAGGFVVHAHTRAHTHFETDGKDEVEAEVRR